MEKSRVFRCLAYLTIMLILLSILPEVSFAAKDSSEHGKGNQDKYMREDARNSSNNETDEVGDTGDPAADMERLQNNPGVKDQNKISDHKQEKNQLKEDLQVHKKEYKEAKGDFLKIRNLVKAGKLDPNSEEALNATKLYLNSSIDYMIAHLSNVKSNMEYSNGNGTEDRIIAIDQKIKLLSTGRQPAYMITKAARAGIPLIATKAMPFDSGVEAAKKANICLIGQLRKESMLIFSSEWRVKSKKK